MGFRDGWREEFACPRLPPLEHQAESGGNVLMDIVHSWLPNPCTDMSVDSEDKARLDVGGRELFGVAAWDVLRLWRARVSVQRYGMEDFLTRDLVQGAFVHHVPRWLRRRYECGRRILCAVCGSLRQPRRKGWSRDAGTIRGQSCGGRQTGVQIVFSYREVK